MKLKSQLDRFKEVARGIGCDEDEGAFDEKLRGIAGRKPENSSDPKPENEKDE